LKKQENLMAFVFGRANFPEEKRKKSQIKTEQFGERVNVLAKSIYL